MALEVEYVQKYKTIPHLYKTICTCIQLYNSKHMKPNRNIHQVIAAFYLVGNSFTSDCETFYSLSVVMIKGCSK